MKSISSNLFSILKVLSLAVLVYMPVNAMARDTTQNQPIADAMATSTAQGFTGVQFFFGDQAYPTPTKTLGNYSTRRSTNAFGKSDAESCQWAFLSGIKTLYERALAEGGNAVVNIKSITTGATFSSTTEYVCRAGNIVTKVYLQADIVTL